MIDYHKIAQSVDYYNNLNYQQIEAPWWVSKETVKITKPDGITENQLYFLETNKKCLVASGEQSYLYLAIKGRLPKGSYQTVTPCFRDESIDWLHRKCFIKNELIIVEAFKKDNLDKIILDAFKFFETQVPNKNLLRVIETQEKTSKISFDILYDDIELGSYGYRYCEFLEWIYGTGCAEPRLTHTIQTIHNK